LTSRPSPSSEYTWRTMHLELELELELWVDGVLG
jgi:hypothetical protein